MSVLHPLQLIDSLAEHNYIQALKDDPRGLFYKEGEWYTWQYGLDCLSPIIGQVYRVEAKNGTQVFKVVRIEEIDKAVTIVKGESGYWVRATFVQVDWDWYLKGGAK